MEIRGTNLAVACRESHPSGTGPPSNDEAEEPCVFGACAFSRPDVDGAAQREGRADFCQDRGSNEHEDHRDDVRRPIYSG